MLRDEMERLGYQHWRVFIDNATRALTIDDRQLSIDDYLEELDLEFPVFAHASCEVLRMLAAEGVDLRQSDPYMEVVLSIYEFFDGGGRPKDIDTESLTGRVYEMERHYSAALLAFYSGSGPSNFDRVVASLQRFAHADARRGRFRDRLRAAEIAEIFDGQRSLYVEAGTLHLPLLGELRSQIGDRARVRPVWLMEQVTRELAQRKVLLSPGDMLTLLYAFRPGFTGPRADLLAARNLIHVKLLEKEERLESSVPDTHTRRELADNRRASRLSYEDCRTLYPQVWSVPTEEARAVVDRYLS